MSEAVRTSRDSGRPSRSGTLAWSVTSSDESSKEEEAEGEFLDMDMDRIIRRGSKVNVTEELEWPELPLDVREMGREALTKKDSVPEKKVTSEKVNVGMTPVLQSISSYLKANDSDSMSNNETQCYISGDTAVGILNFVEGVLAKVDSGAKIAPKGLLHVFEASMFNEHQICSFTVAVRMCNKRARNDDIDDPTDDNNSMLMPQSTPDDSCHILEFGMCFGDKDQFYALYHHTVDALLGSGWMVHERFQDGLQRSKPSESFNPGDVHDEKTLQPLGITGPPPFPSELKSSNMDYVWATSQLLVDQPPLADVLYDMLTGDSICMQFEGTKMSSLLSSQHWGRAYICASENNSLKSLINFLICLAEDVILRSREGGGEDEGAPAVAKKSSVDSGVTGSSVNCLDVQRSPRLRKHQHDSFAAMFAMRAISSLVRDSRSLALVDSKMFESLLAICSFTVFLPSSIHPDPADGDVGCATSRYWKDLAYIEAQIQGALAVERICDAAQASVIDEKVLLAKGPSARHELLKAIALCSSPELAPYLSHVLNAWQSLLSKRRAVRELTSMKIIPAPYVAAVGGGTTTRAPELPRPVEFKVTGEFPTLFALVTRYLSTLDNSQWDDGKFESKLYADVELQPPHSSWAVTLYTASQYCDLDVLIRHSSDSETVRECLLQFQFKSGGAVEFSLLVNKLLQLIHEKTDLMVPNLEGIESKEGLVLLSSPPFFVPSSSTAALDRPSSLSGGDGGLHFGDADDATDRYLATVISESNDESLSGATTRLLLGDEDSSKLQGARLASSLTATPFARERLLCSSSSMESETVQLVEALVYVAFQKRDDETVDKPYDDGSKHTRLFAIMALSNMVWGPNPDVRACNALANTSISIDQARDCAYAVARTRGSAEALQSVLFCHKFGGQAV